LAFSVGIQLVGFSYNGIRPVADISVAPWSSGSSNQMMVILHNIRSLHNVGSIFRTADAAGVDKLYLCGITPAPVDRFGKVRPPLAKVALGAEKSVSWESCNQTNRLISKLRADGFKILAVEQDKRSVPLFNVWRINLQKLAVVVGNEVKGLPKSILNNCDLILEIPMAGKKESLNVAVSFGIVVFHLRSLCKNYS